MILCLGPSPTVQRTMTFDGIRLGAVNRATSVRESASGKSVNVATVLHAVGADVLALGFAGGRRGEFLRQHLDAAGVRHDFWSVTPVTRLCTTVVDRAARVATELVEEPAPLSRSDAHALLRLLKDRLRPARALVLSGTLPEGLDDDFYARCVAAASAAGVPTMIDARGPSLRRALEEKPLVVKLNRQELAETLQCEIASQTALISAMRELIGLGAGWVVVTQGSGPTLATNGPSAWQAGSLRVETMNPVGSGDAFAAGFMVGLLRHRHTRGDADAGESLIPRTWADGLPAALALAVACGAANALTEPTACVVPSDVERLLPTIAVASLPTD